MSTFSCVQPGDYSSRIKPNPSCTKQTTRGLKIFILLKGNYTVPLFISIIRPGLRACFIVSNALISSQSIVRTNIVLSKLQWMELMPGVYLFHIKFDFADGFRSSFAQTYNNWKLNTPQIWRWSNLRFRLLALRDRMSSTRMICRWR